MPTHRVRVGWIVAGSIVAGLTAAVLLAFAPFVTADANTFTGMVLLGFAVGWALLAGLSTWLGDQPQRWAAAPALFMGLSGAIVLLGSDAFVDGVVSWVWPPALLVLVVWVFRARQRDLHSRTRPLLLYPVLAVLVLFALGGGYERVGESMTPLPPRPCADNLSTWAAPAAPGLHRLRKPDRGARARRWGHVVGHGLDHARRGPRHPGLCL